MIQNITYHFSFDKIFETESAFDEQDKEWVYTHYVGRLFKMSASLGLAAVPAYWIFAIVILPIIDTSQAIIWASLMMLAPAYQVGIDIYSRGKALSKRQIKFILFQFSIVAIIVGIGWSFLAFTLVQGQNDAYLILGLFFVGGTVLTTIIAQHLSISICVFSIIAGLVPISAAFFHLNSDHNIFASFLVLVYAFFLCRLAFQQRSASFQSIILQRKQHKLVAELEAQSNMLREVRREADENLELLTEALNAMPDGIVIYNKEDVQVHCNAVYREIYDYKEDFNTIGKTYWQMLEADIEKGTITREIATRYAEQRKLQKDSGDGEIEVQLKNGRWIHIRDRKTQTGITITINTDVTVRKELEAEILKDKQAADEEVIRQRDEISKIARYYEAIVEDQTEFISRLDPDLRLTFANSAYKKVFFGDEKAKNVIGHSILDVIADANEQKSYKEILEGLTPRYPFSRSTVLRQTADGSYQWQSWIDRAIFDASGILTGYQSVGRDITAQKIAERALSNNLEERQAIISGALDAILTIDEHDCVREYNPAAENVFGWKRDAVIGQKAVPMIAAHVSGDATRFIDYLISHTGIDVFGRRLEIDLLRKDGRTFPAEVAVVKVLRETDQSSLNAESDTTFITYVRDLSENKALEKEMEKQRNAVVQSEKLGAMGSLLANVAHELNNPLAVVIGQTEILNELVIDEAISKRTVQIKTAAQRCASIVKTFLAAVRQKEPERHLFDPLKSIEKSVQLVDYAYKSHGIELNIQQTENVPLIYGDEDQIGQVLTNLLVNAQQELAKNQKERKVLLVVSTTTDKRSVLISVEDNGVGIPEEQMEKIFEPFYTTKEIGVGTGIGLAIARNIMESHDGNLSVNRSAQLGGACFEITIPVPKNVDFMPQSKIKRKQPLNADQKLGHVLIVDDEIEVANIAADHFIIARFNCDVAHDGETALKLMAQKNFDVIISDLRMPQIDGPSLYHKAEEKWPGIKKRFGFFTGDNLSSDMKGFLSDPDIRAIDKPFTSEELIELAETIINEN